MRKFTIIGMLCFLSMLTTLYGIESQDAKKQVEKRLQDFIEAINKTNVDAFPSFWTQDVTIMNPGTGEVYKGKSEIIDYLQKRNQEIRDRQLNFTFTPAKIVFPAPDQAVVEGSVEIKDKGQLVQRVFRKIKLSNVDGQWLIKEVREIEVAPAPDISPQLKDLEWLIGNWKDSDEDVTISFSAKHDKYNNFIVQNFKMEIYDQEAMEGMQIIGWDPIEKTIRSWVYDSDGGFGQGTWAKKDGVWYVASKYVLSDGSKAAATNIYSEINDRSYRYSSIDRSIDGELLDNIAPVTVRKE